MGKQIWKAGNMLYPVPAVLVSCADENGNKNIMTVAWTGTVCSEPPMVSISVRPERYSYRMIHETKEFVINLTTEKLVRAADFAGVRSGRDTDKWKELHLTAEKASKVKAPIIGESPLSLECRVVQEIPLGSHNLFLAEVLAVDADESYMDRNGKFDLNKTDLIAYSHGEYFSLGKLLGTFGYSIKKETNESSQDSGASGVQNQKPAEESGNRAERKTGYRKEHKTGYRKENRAGSRKEYKTGSREDRRSGDRKEYRTGNREDHRSGDRKEYRTGNREDRRSGDRKEYRTGSREDRRSGDRKEYRTGSREDRRSGDRKEYRTGSREDRRSGDRKEHRTENRTWNKAGNRGEHRTGNRGEHRTGNRTGRRQGEK